MLYLLIVSWELRGCCVVVCQRCSCYAWCGVKHNKKKTTKKEEKKTKNKKKSSLTLTHRKTRRRLSDLLLALVLYLITRSKCFVCICFAVRWYRYRYRYYNYCFFGFCFTHTYTHTPTSERGAQGIKSIFNTSLQRDIYDLSCLCLCLYVCMQFTRFLLHSTLVNELNVHHFSLIIHFDSELLLLLLLLLPLLLSQIVVTFFFCRFFDCRCFLRGKRLLHFDIE